MPHNPYLRDLARLLASQSFPMPSSSGNWVNVLWDPSGNWADRFSQLNLMPTFRCSWSTLRAALCVRDSQLRTLGSAAHCDVVIV